MHSIRMLMENNPGFVFVKCDIKMHLIAFHGPEFSKFLRVRIASNISPGMLHSHLPLKEL